MIWIQFWADLWYLPDFDNRIKKQLVLTIIMIIEEFNNLNQEGTLDLLYLFLAPSRTHQLCRLEDNIGFFGILQYFILSQVFLLLLFQVQDFLKLSHTFTSSKMQDLGP